VVELRVSPLRDRSSDILPLARNFLIEGARRWRRAGLHFTPAAETALMTHSWPGNVRELKNVVEQAVVLGVGEAIEPAHLALSQLDGNPQAEPDQGFRLPEQGMQIVDLERDMLSQALVRSAWNVSAAARLLGLSRDTVRYRMQKYGLLRQF
jgi:DNA-binding NtrC family response regulator